MTFEELNAKYNECCARLGDAMVKKESLERLIDNLKLEITDLQVAGSKIKQEAKKPEEVKPAA